MHWKPLLTGIASCVPGLLPLLRGPARTRGSDSARYCYAVWMRHWLHAVRAGLPDRYESVAELGPGDSLGCGLAALLCGSRRYLAFDVVRYAPQERNLRMLDALVALFRARTDIPGEDEFPGLKPPLADRRFPKRALDAKRLSDALAPERVESIRAALRGLPNPHGIEVRYCVPWQDAVEPGSVDLVFSQAVLEHVDDPAGAWAAMARWLAPGGVASHQIDFRSHRLTPAWDGHRAYSDRAWRVVRGRRPYLLNRAPCSTHLALLERDFDLRTEWRSEREPQTPRRALAARFRSLDASDRRTAGVFLQARRRRTAPGDTEGA